MVPPRRILAVFNPAAGGQRRARFDRVLAALHGHGCHVSVVETTAPRHAETIAHDAVTGPFDVIAAAGGDGTINEVINGLGDSTMPLGVIPLGTANVFARDMGLDPSPTAVACALALGPVRDIRVGRANQRRFAMMAGIGFDANVVHGVSLALKRRIGPLAYVWQACRQAATGRFETCSVTIDGVAHTAVSIVVCKGRHYGGPFIAAPKASLHDDQFHVLLMNGRGWFSVLRYGVALILNQLSTAHDVRVIAARDVTVHSPIGQAVQTDGDSALSLPVHMTIDPHPVRVVFPA